MPIFCAETVIAHSLRISLSTVLLPAPIPPPMRRSTGLLSLWATGAITSVHWESSFTAIPIAFISSTNVLKTLATFRFLATLSNLWSLSKQKIRWSNPFEYNCRFSDNSEQCKSFNYRIVPVSRHGTTWIAAPFKWRGKKTLLLLFHYMFHTFMDILLTELHFIILAQMHKGKPFVSLN